MKQDYEVREADVLVIGGGMAGLWAAIRAKQFAPRVVLAEKGKVGRSGISVFCHAYVAPVSDDLLEPVLKEAVEKTAYLGDQTWIDLIYRENGERIEDMERWGVVFEKDDKGNIKSEAVRGQKIGVTALAQGRQVIETMSREALRRGVEFAERTMVIDLLTSDGSHPTQGHVVGAVAMHTRTGRFVVFKCKAVVIASGGISAKLHCLYADNVTGDGHAMAFRAGAQIGGMELSPSFMFSIWNRRFCTGGQGQFLTGGGKLVNRIGEQFLQRYPEAAADSIGFDGQGDLGDLCRAIAVEIMEGRGPVYFDLRGWGRDKIEKLRRVLPFTMLAFDEAGIDVSRDLVETTPLPVAYGMNAQSGIRVNALAESSVKGLYAAGAVSMVGYGILAQGLCTVQGYRAGENAGERARAIDFCEVPWEQVEKLKQAIFAPLQVAEGITPDQLYYSVNEVVTPFEASLFKHAKRIRGVLEEIRRIASEDLPRVRAADTHELVKANEARNFILMMEMVNVSAMAREESRLTTYREEYPYRDDCNWLKWILLRNGGEGRIELKIEPVPFDSYPVRPSDRSQIRSVIQFSMKKPDVGLRGRP